MTKTVRRSARRLQRLADPEGEHPNSGEVASLTYARVIGELSPSRTAPAPIPLGPQLCRQADFARDAYRYWCSAFRERPRLHRKQWEFFYICQVLHERGLLAEGRAGLGFGVGREPLPALFASRGCTIVATDQDPEMATQAGWQETGQHASHREALANPAICPMELFNQRVTFQFSDMNAIPAEFAGRFDFCWSACSLEHLGSLEHGLSFIERSLETLKPGGIAVHTTEFNLSSDYDTVESRDLSVYRRQDIERLTDRLTAAGHKVEPVSFDRGSALVDGHVDLPPYRSEPHLRLRIEGYDCTSIGLIVRRAPG